MCTKSHQLMEHCTYMYYADGFSQALAQLADGSVASGVPVKVKVTINNDVTTLFEDELLSEEEEGAVSLDIAVPAHAKCMKISVSTDL